MLLLFAAYLQHFTVLTGLSVLEKSAWAGMVFWALVAAYSHYYALVAAGILLFGTGVAVWLKHRGKTWVKGISAIAVFILIYTPWMFFLFTALKNVSNSWWMTDILGLDKSLVNRDGWQWYEQPYFPAGTFADSDIITGRVVTFPD